MRVHILFLSILLVASAFLRAQAPAIDKEAAPVCTVMIAEGRPESGEYRIVFSTEIPQTPTFTCAGEDKGNRWAIGGEWLKQGDECDLKLNFEYGNPEGMQQRLATRIVLPTGDALICLGGMTAFPEGAPKRQSLILLRRSAPDAPPLTVQAIAEAAKAFGQRTMAVAGGQKTIKLQQPPTQAYLGDIPVNGHTFHGAANGQNPWQSNASAPSAISEKEAASVCTVMIAVGRPKSGAYRIVFSTEFAMTDKFKHKGSDGGVPWKIEGGRTVDAIRLSFEYGKSGTPSHAFTLRTMLPQDSLYCLIFPTEAAPSTPRDFFFIRRSAPDAPPPTAQAFAKAIAEGIARQKRAMPAGSMNSPPGVEAMPMSTP